MSILCSQGGGNFPFIMCGLYIVTSFQRDQYGNRKKSNFTMETPNKYYPNLKVTSSVISQVDTMYQRYDAWEWQFSFLAFLPQTYNHSLTMGKASGKSILEGPLQNYWPVLPKMYTTSRTRKFWKTVTTKRSQKRHKD